MSDSEGSLLESCTQLSSALLDTLSDHDISNMVIGIRDATLTTNHLLILIVLVTHLYVLKTGKLWKHLGCNRQVVESSTLETIATDTHASLLQIYMYLCSFVHMQ